MRPIAPAGFVLASEATLKLWNGFSDDFSKVPDWVDVNLIEPGQGDFEERERDAELMVEFALISLVSTGLYAWDQKNEPRLVCDSMFLNGTYPETMLFHAYSSVIGLPRNGVSAFEGAMGTSENSPSELFQASTEAIVRNFAGDFALFKMSAVETFLQPSRTQRKGKAGGKKTCRTPNAFERRLQYFRHLTDDEVRDLSWEEVLRILSENGKNVGKETARKFLPKLKEYRGLPRR